MNNYDAFTQRNVGYVDRATQERIAKTRVLIAGCGIGSQMAEAAARIGFCHFTLIDGDQVSISNLNRQSYWREDVGKNKASALAEHLRAINPEVQVKSIAGVLTAANAKSLVAEADLIFDSIDFLDLPAIIALHDQCFIQKKHLISAVAVGWGAAAIYFPPLSRSQCWARDLFKIQDNGPMPSYAEAFLSFFAGIKDHLDPQVLAVSAQALKVMEDGSPCPASQVSAGAFAVASLGVTLACRVLAGQEVHQAPELILVDMYRACFRGGITLR